MRFRAITNEIFKVKYLKNLLFLLCIGITVFLMVVFALNQYIAIEKTEQQALSILKTEMNMVQINVDDTLAEFERASLNIGTHDDVREFMKVKSPMSMEDRLLAGETLEGIEMYRLSSEVLSDSYVYFTGSDVALTLSGVTMDKEAIYERHHSGGQISISDWEEIFANRASGLFLFDRGDDGDKIYYIQSLPIDEKGEPKAVFVGCINAKTVLPNVVASGVSSDVSVYTVDESGKMINLLGGGLISSDEQQAYNKLVQKGSEYKSEKIDRHSYGMFCLSERFDLKYLMIIPDRVMNESGNLLIVCMMICILLVVVMGVIFTKMLFKYTYTPIKNIINTAGIRLNAETDSIKEFDAITKYIVDGVDIRKKFEHISEIHKNTLKNRFLCMLLDGVCGDNKFLEQGIEKYCSFTGDNFAVVLFRIESSGNTGEEIFLSDESIIFLLNNVANDVFGAEFVYETAEVSNGMALIFNSNEININDIATRAEWIIAFIADSNKVLLNAVVGGIKYGFSGISVSYSQCQELLEYRCLTNADGVLMYDDILDKKNQKVLLRRLRGIHSQMTGLINIGAVEEVRTLAENMIEDEFKQGGLPLDVLREQIFLLIENISNVMSRQGDELFAQPDEDSVDTLMQYTSLDDLKSRIGYILSTCGEYNNILRMENDENMWNKVIEYIEENYTDIDLNVSKIALEFSFNLSTFSQSFKQKYGVRPLDYIHRKRIDLAKQLLDKNLSIKKVAESIGYIDSDSFIKKFKKYEGITPGKYQKLNKPQHQD